MDAFQEGYKAHGEGRKRAHNPKGRAGYCSDWLDWDAGWVSAMCAADDSKRLMDGLHNRAVAEAIGEQPNDSTGGHDGQ